MHPDGMSESKGIDRDGCLRLLGRHGLGRVIFTESALPTALPVTFAVDLGEIVFRVRDRSALAHATRHAVVAFEVDEIDAVALSGWSVVAVGETYEVTDPVRLHRLSAVHMPPWAPAGPALTVAVRLQRLTGSRLSCVPATHTQSLLS